MKAKKREKIVFPRTAQALSVLCGKPPRPPVIFARRRPEPPPRKDGRGGASQGRGRRSSASHGLTPATFFFHKKPSFSGVTDRKASAALHGMEIIAYGIDTIRTKQPPGRKKRCPGCTIRNPPRTLRKSSRTLQADFVKGSPQPVRAGNKAVRDGFYPVQRSGHFSPSGRLSVRIN